MSGAAQLYSMCNRRSNPAGMSSMVLRDHRSAGFSLAEALVALAIAAVLAVALTRLVSNTRANAGKIRELVEMMTLSDSLLEQTTSQQPGITQGRTGRFAWRVAIVPMAFNAVARRVNEKVLAVADQHQSKAPGSTSTSDSSFSKPTPAPEQAPNKIPFRVNVLVESPSGRRYAADTIRIGAPAADE
jgi:type II secretory pathway pseudopilin PulG